MFRSSARHFGVSLEVTLELSVIYLFIFVSYHYCGDFKYEPSAERSMPPLYASLHKLEKKLQKESSLFEQRRWNHCAFVTLNKQNIF